MKKKIILLTIVGVFLIIAGVLIFQYYKDKKEIAIPKVYFTGNISNMESKKDERLISLKYVSDKINFNSYAIIKVQGTSSLQYEKKNYTINLYADENYKNKQKIDVGWGGQSKYCLKANWIDKTHARNIVTAQLVAEVQNKFGLFTETPNNGVIDGFPVEIYINNEFLGIYTWNIPKDAWMFNMDEDNKNHIVYAGEGWANANNFKEKSYNDEWGIEVGAGDKEDLDKLNRLINFVNTSTDKEFKEKFNNYLDFDSTINYLIIMYFAQLEDNAAKNMLLATYDGLKWYPTLYDLDTSWGASYNGLSLMDYTNIEGFRYNKLWDRMLDLYPKEISDRYFELRKNILTKEHILKLFNDFRYKIPKESFNKEKAKWQNLPGYDYSQIEEFLNIRIPIIDNYMKNLIK